MKLYAAHGFKNHRHKLSLWEYIETEVRCEIVNPFYADDRESAIEITKGTMTNADLNPSEVVNGDKQLILGCDGLLAILDENAAYGTIIELAFAFESGISTFVLAPLEHKDHPWLRYYADVLVTSVPDLVDALRDCTDIDK